MRSLAFAILPLVLICAGCNRKSFGRVEVSGAAQPVITVEAPAKKPFLPWRLKFEPAGYDRKGPVAESAIQVKAKNLGMEPLFISPWTGKEPIAIQPGASEVIFEGTVDALFAINTSRSELMIRNQGVSKMELRFVPAAEFAGKVAFDVALFRRKETVAR